jgi:hypothetical protein
VAVAVAVQPDSRGGLLSVVDLSDPSQPLLRGTLPDPWLWHGRVALTERGAWVLTGGDLVLVDVADADRPHLVARSPAMVGYPPTGQGIAAEAGRAYVASSDAVLTSFTLTDRACRGSCAFLPLATGR